MITNFQLKGNETLLIIKNNDIIFTSEEKGIKALAKLYCQKSLLDTIVIDKIVGKSAMAFLIEGGATNVYAKTISLPALSLANKKIEVSYDLVVDYVKNRSGDGQCPMEALVMGCLSAKECVDMLLSKLSPA